MPDGRKFTTPARLLAALAALTMGVVGVFVVAPAHADPKIDEVKAKVDRLYHEAEVASEQYNTAKVRLEATKRELAAVQSDLSTQQAKVDSMRRDVATLVVSQFQGQALSTATEVALADDPGAFLDRLNAVTAYNSQRTEVLDSYGVELTRLEQRQAAVREESKSLASVTEELHKQKAVIDEKAAAAKDELDKLEAEERAKLAASGSAAPASLPSVPASGRAGAAVSYAMAQVGKAYVYGAAGPSAFDCSGLTMRAWGAAGVGLSHSSRAQTGEGAPVSQGQLQPGDLVFYYSPVSHVGIYIGNGMIVHAANPSSGVRVDPVNSMPYSGAVRPG